MMPAIKSESEQKLASLNRRDQAIYTQLEEEQKKRDEKTAKLRALRLAKEATDRKAAELLALEKADIKAQLLKLNREHGPIAANRSRATLNALFVWAIQQGFLDLNPVVGTVAPAEERTRDRVLTNEELRAIWQSTTNASDYNRIVRLLILTGQRREEIAGMRWSEVDLDAEVFTMLADRTKNKRSHSVPLSKQALDILKTIPRRANRDLLFGEGRGSFFGVESIEAATGPASRRDPS